MNRAGFTVCIARTRDGRARTRAHTRPRIEKRTILSYKKKSAKPYPQGLAGLFMTVKYNGIFENVFLHPHERR